MKRQLDDRVENYKELIDGSCACGQMVVKVIGSSYTARIDKVRFHYPYDTDASCIYRCKKYSEPISRTFKQDKL